MQIVKMVEHFFKNIPDDKFGMDVMEFELMLETDKIKDYFLLDIREKNLFDKFRLKGSENIPFKELGKRFTEIPEDKKVIIICNTGFTAAQTASLLNMLGYTTWALRDGIEGYIDMGGEVDKSPNNLKSA